MSLKVTPCTLNTDALCLLASIRSVSKVYIQNSGLRGKSVKGNYKEGASHSRMHLENHIHVCLSKTNACTHAMCSALTFTARFLCSFSRPSMPSKWAAVGPGWDQSVICMAWGIGLKILGRTGKTVQGMYTLAWGWAPERPRLLDLKCRRPRKTEACRVGLGESRQAGAMGALRKEHMHPSPQVSTLPHTSLAVPTWSCCSFSG